MSEPAISMLFVPIPPDVQGWKANFIQRVFKSLEDTPHATIKEICAPGDISHLHLTRQQIIDRMALSEEDGSLSCENFAGFWLNVWFFRARPQAAYQPLNIDISQRSFSGIQGDPMKVEAFSAAWTQMCESIGVEAAYFSEANYTDPDLLINEGSDFLQRGDVQAFVSGGWWRTYLNPRLTTIWRERFNISHRADWRERFNISHRARVEELPSGALLIANGRGYNPEVGDWDALFNARFLLEQVEKRAEMPGASHLLDVLHLEEKCLVRIEDDKDYSKHGDDAFYDYEGLKEARAILDDVRATWVCALQRPGLVGVQQSFIGQPGEVKVIVPVVADEGREWLLATLLYPFDTTEAAWSDQQTGLWVRVQYMQQIAQSNLVHGEPPRIVVFFWRGVSTEVREELTVMGVHVEVASHLPLLE